MDTTPNSSSRPGVGDRTVIDVVVLGGGLAGLTAATVAARAGTRVHLLDARSELGGRARTAVHHGFSFNEGPHALYKASRGTAILRELGLSPKGGNPPFVRTRLSLAGRARRTLPPRTVGQVLAVLRRLKADATDSGLVAISAQEWIDGRTTDAVARQVVAALVRVSTYSGDLTTLSADAAATQLLAATKGVTYLHDGWGQLVGGLTDAARRAGVGIETGAKAISLTGDGDRWVITLGDDRRVWARAVIVAAGGPDVAHRLIGGSSPTLAAAATAIPVHAACLELGLGRLPRPSTRFILGIDKATYASIHTPGAHLAEHGHVVHLMHYEPGDDVGIVELEALAQELQPGWRDHELARQIGQRRVVAFDRPQPGTGLRGRPRVTATDQPGLFVAGDWVGPHDLLGGAAISSGKAAGLAAAGHSDAVIAAPEVAGSAPR